MAQQTTQGSAGLLRHLAKFACRAHLSVPPEVVKQAKLSILDTVGCMVEFCQQKRSNNTSGVAGVHFLKTPAQPMGIWQAKLKVGGKGQHKSFSVRKYGYQRAYELSIAAREHMLSLAEDSFYLYDKLARQKAPDISPNVSTRQRTLGFPESGHSGQDAAPWEQRCSTPSGAGR